MKRSHIAFAVVCSVISALCVWGVRTVADYQITQGSGTSMASFTFTGVGGTVHIAKLTPIASDGSTYVDGTSSDAVCSTDTGTCSIVSLLKRANQNLASPPALGTTGGWSPKLLNGLTSVPVVVKNTTGQLGSVYCYNPSGAVAYLQVFDTSPTVTVGTTSPVQSYGIPTTNASGLAMAIVGLQFTNAIQVASTTAAFTSASVSMDCNVWFK